LTALFETDGYQGVRTLPRLTFSKVSTGCLIAFATLILTSPSGAYAQSADDAPVPNAAPVETRSAPAESSTPEPAPAPAAPALEQTPPAEAATTLQKSSTSLEDPSAQPQPTAVEDVAPQAGAPAQDAPASAMGPAPDAPGGVGVDRQALPHDLSPWGMFLVADIVVQAVMVGLVLASIATWTIWLAKSLELAAARSRTRKALAVISSETSLSDSATRLGDRRGVVTAFIEAARKELQVSDDGADKSGLKERVESRLDGLRAAAARQMNAGTGILATIGSTAPFGYRRSAVGDGARSRGRHPGRHHLQRLLALDRRLPRTSHGCGRRGHAATVARP